MRDPGTDLNTDPGKRLIQLILSEPQPGSSVGRASFKGPSLVQLN